MYIPYFYNEQLHVAVTIDSKYKTHYNDDDDILDISRIMYINVTYSTSYIHISTISQHNLHAFRVIMHSRNKERRPSILNIGTLKKECNMI